ncbi:MAG: hypothetical protein HYZ16_11630 [Bacteroidetes bacterium]|nr:hypothetical protein [Bacteroidota bacterium]
MYKISAMLLILMLFGHHAVAQYRGFRIGYALNMGRAKEINRVLYIYNSTGNFTRPMNYLRYTKGLVFSYLWEDEVGGIELTWQNRHAICHSQWDDPTLGLMQRDIKFRTNALAMNLFMRTNSGIYGGLGIDLGSWKLWTRRATAAAIADSAFTKISIVNSHDKILPRAQVSVPIFIGFDKRFVGARLTYQLQTMRMYLDDLDNVLVGRSIDANAELKDRYGNLGLTIYLKLVWEQ